MPMSDNRLTERVQAAVRAAVRESGVTRLLVACSGGADSICLAHATVAVARQEGWPLMLGHVRHGVRVDDAADAATVEALADTLGVACAVHVYAHRSLAAHETALRQARYAALAEMMTAFGAEALLTGHTRDDQAETVLLRLLRGAGVDGLAAIATDAPFPYSSQQPVPTVASPRVLRPLLDVRRAETRAYCAAHRLPFRDDPSNTDPAYRRNWVRHAVLPLLTERYPAATDTLARTAGLMREDAAYLETLTQSALSRCTVPSSSPAVTTFDRAAFTAEPVALRRRMLRAVIAMYSPTAPRADRLAIVRWAMSGSGTTGMQTVASVAFWPAYGGITIGREGDVVAAVRHHALHRHPLARYDDMVPFERAHLFTTEDILSPSGASRFRLAVIPVTRADERPPGAMDVRLPEGLTLSLRNRRAGDRFSPAPGAHTRTLGEYLTDKGVPAPLRDELPLLVGGAGDTLVAVIGYDVAGAFAATTATAATATHWLTLLALPPLPAAVDMKGSPTIDAEDAE